MIRRQVPENDEGQCCTFCGKQREQVERLIAGPARVYICNECVVATRDYLAEMGALPNVDVRVIDPVGADSAPAISSGSLPIFLLCGSCGVRCYRTDNYCFHCGQKLEHENKAFIPPVE